MSTEKRVNPGGVIMPDDIINKIVSFGGLFKKIFGDLLPPLIYSPAVENNVHVLENLFGFKDARRIFPKRLIKGEFDKVSETVFRIIKPNESGIFNKNE